jgi:hypothetical protein
MSLLPHEKELQSDLDCFKRSVSQHLLGRVRWPSFLHIDPPESGVAEQQVSQVHATWRAATECGIIPHG